MTKWNNIPWNEDATPEEKADQFERQYEENKESAEAKGDNSNPYRPGGPGVDVG